MNKESPNASSSSTSHEVFTFSRVREGSNSSSVEHISDQIVVEQKCVDDAMLSRTVTVEEQQSPRYSDKRGNNYDAWYRHLFLPRYGGEPAEEFYMTRDRMRLDISIDQMQLFCLPGIADSFSERKQFSRGVKVFRSLLVTGEQQEWKERVERNVYNKLHWLSTSPPCEKRSATDRAYMIAFLRDSEEDMNSTEDSRASYILLEFVCKTKRIYYYDVLEQLLEQKPAKMERRERVMGFINEFRMHESAQAQLEDWTPAASVQFDVERGKQNTLALSSWWCLSMLLSRAQVHVKSRRVARGSMFYIERDTDPIEKRVHACPAAGPNHPWSMAHDQIKLWLLCVWARMDQVRPCVEAERMKKVWDEGHQGYPPASVLLKALPEE